MKMKKSISKILLSLVLCFSVLPVPHIATSASAATGVFVQSAGGLADISVTGNGVSAFSFDPEILSYSVDVPIVYADGDVTEPTYTVPTVIATAAEGYTADVSLPETLPGKAVISVADAEGQTVGSYEIRFTLKGENFYADGGFESGEVGSNTSFVSSYDAITVTDSTALFGAHSAYRIGGSDYMVYQPAVVLEPGKTYLSSRSSRTLDGVSYDARDCVESLTDGQTATVAFYQDGTHLATNTTDASSDARVILPTSMTENWTQLQAVIAPTTPYNVMHFDIHRDWAGCQTYVDNAFLGELVAASVSVTNENLATSTRVGALNTEQTITLKAAVLNQLGTGAGFDDAGFNWNCDAGITVNDGVVTVPAGTAAGSYTVTAESTVTIGERSAKVVGTHEITVGHSGGLGGLMISGTVADIDFDPFVFSYTAAVPILYKDGDITKPTYTIPKINAAADSGKTAQIIMPETLPGTAVITVTDTAGMTVGTYEIHISLVGENLYANGGFEQTGIPYKNEEYGANTARKITDKPAFGDYSLEITFKGDPNYMIPRVTMESGKTYLSSRMMRMTDRTTNAGAMIRMDGFSGISTFYAGGMGTQTATDSQSYAVNITNEWQRFDTVITPNTDWTDTQMYHSNDWATANYAALDNCYLGELLIGDIAIKANGKALPAVMSTAEAQQLTLSAQALNQLGDISGLDSRVTTDILGIDSAPRGVTYSDGVLSIPQNTEGKLVLKAQATPTAEWTNAKQTVFVKTLVIDLQKAAVTSGKLASLEIVGNGLSDCVFDEATESYSVGVPVYYEDGDVEKLTYTMPELIATAADASESADVVMPQALPGIAIVRLTNSEGQETGSYKVHINLLGQNMYVNGSFEREGIPYGSGAGIVLNKTTENPAVGNQCLEIQFKSEPYGFMPTAKLAANKTYLSSRMLRRTAQTVADGTNPNLDIYQRLDGFGGNHSATFGGQALTAQDVAYVLNLTDDWQTLNVILEPNADWDDKQMYHTYSWATWDYLALDNAFLGEMIIGDIAVTANGKALPNVLSTAAAHQLTLSASAVNQLGQTDGLAGRVKTESLTLVKAPDGVTLEGGVLTIPQGTKGMLVLKAQAVPTTVWSNAPQKSFTKTLHIMLTEDAFSYAAEEDTVDATLALYYTGETGLGTLYHAVYDNVDGVLRTVNVTGEPIALLQNEFICKTTKLQAAQGQVVKSFILKDGIISPIAPKGIYIR